MSSRHQQSAPRSRQARAWRGRTAKAVAALAVLGGLTLAGTLPSSATATGRATSSAEADHQDRDNVQRGIDALVHKDGYPAALAAVRGEDGRTRNYASGVADLKTQTKAPVDGQVRIGSNTKTFTAVVVLQLVGEGKVGLDEPIETYLPGVVRGEGIDGRKITVRQLLQHTSGLPNYTDFLAEADFFDYQHVYAEPYELLNMALASKAKFAPGEKWEYSNTNYVLAGLIVQKVTKRPVGEEIHKRIIRPLGLRNTYFPTVGEERIRGKHPKGYHASKPGGQLRDITRMDPSLGWAAGQMVSTPSEVNRFFTALFDGKLLRPAEMKEMRTTVEAIPGVQWGLGVSRTDLECGGAFWGHGGDIFGYSTRGGVTEDGRAVTVTVTALPLALSDAMTANEHLENTVHSALCDK